MAIGTRVGTQLIPRMNRINIILVLARCDNLGQEEATGGEFQGSIVGLFGRRLNGLVWCLANAV